ncbi:MAG: phosphoribosylamine--glycine ligase [Candidatus Omnitrophica bacterium]|nr:phosphoribosylamine--glycine ligase [Candidatus Omnitrophota bacterium]
MKVLVVGSGAREHALVWKISQSRLVKKIYCAPGNAGIGQIAELVDIKPEDINGLLEFALSERIGLTVVGPEAPLSAGIVDVFKERGLRIFGPGKNASALESSKIFAKKIMKKYRIPTAEFEVFFDYEQALAFVKDARRPLVIKADGLCAGKGVFVCDELEDQEQALSSIFKESLFGEAGRNILIEEKLDGEEASIIVISDGKNIVSMASSQDHKRVFDNDEGPNTGGMGAYSPAPAVNRKIFKQIEEKIIIPVIRAMEKERALYCGVLYAGIMLTQEGPKVLEFNVRFGDPETQAILPRLKSDLVEVMLAALEQKLKNYSLEWDNRACVCVVLASGGYPGGYEKGKKITGLEKIKSLKDVFVFHSGTKFKGGEVVTDGGRVLGVTALGKDIKAALSRVYNTVGMINFEKMHYRKDIGRRALVRRNDFRKLKRSK